MFGGSGAGSAPGGASKLATVHEGSSHTLNTQFGALYNQSNELASMQSITHLFYLGWKSRSSLGHHSLAI